MAIVKTHIITAANISVAPTSTVLVLPVHVSIYQRAILQVTNTDLTQNLNVFIETSRLDTGPFVQSIFDVFFNMAPGTTANEELDITSFEYIRVSGTASGSGLTATVSLSVMRELP